MKRKIQIAIGIIAVIAIVSISAFFYMTRNSTQYAVNVTSTALQTQVTQSE
ncbi:MAG: hypothetical protein KC615_16470 [Anaerolineae bacterium]|nr:hypothetical protein [Anaerolineae bacterium]